jgi:hypothetical protein
MILRDALIEPDSALIESRLPYSTAQEFDSYVWSHHGGGEQPVDQHNHGMDAMRYAVQFVDAPPSQPEAELAVHVISPRRMQRRREAIRN